MNNINIQPIEFKNLRTGAYQYGFTAEDSYGAVFSSSFTQKPEVDDLEFLKQVLEFKSPALEELVNHIVRTQSGITIGKTFYEWGKIEPIVDGAKAPPAFSGGFLTIGLAGSKRVMTLDPNGWAQFLMSRQHAEILAAQVGAAPGTSELSGESAYTVDILEGDRELRLKLSVGEFRRLILKSLTKEEWAKLKANHGAFLWINENLYSETGEALIPAL